MTTPDPTTPEEQLPYGGTVRDLRVQIVRQAVRAEKVFEATTLAAPPWSGEHRQLNLMAHGASLYSWATASLLGFIAERFGDQAAVEAAAMVQDMGMNGGAEWCDDLGDEIDAEVGR